MKSVFTFLALCCLHFHAYSCSCAPRTGYPTDGLQQQDLTFRTTYWKRIFAESHVFTAEIKQLEEPSKRMTRSDGTQSFVIHNIVAVNTIIQQRELTLYNASLTCPQILKPGSRYVFIVPKISNLVTACNSWLAESDADKQLSTAFNKLKQ